MAICASCGRENPEGARFCNACGGPMAVAPAREQRKTVTVLFCDVTGSTALGESVDPEALRALLARFFERMRAIVERHGGTVEKFIGDAVMAVFGVPRVHEDDALRAVRAAVEMRMALPELGVRARIGVNTGEVVTGTEERLATGDAVNVAARLEQAAAPGEVLLGERTLSLVRDAVEVEAVAPLALKGKADRVPAFRLVALTGEPARRHGAPLVGRETELRRLRDAFEQAARDRSCQLFTLLGAAGVGKSRLAYEFLQGLDATVVRGRCLSYGEGITYSPLVEVLRQLDALPSDPAARASLRSLLGETNETTSADEIAWAFRKLLEERAAERPLVCVFDDLHWAEQTFFDLIEHVADLSRDAPFLLLCLARPELLDERPGWGGGKLNATTVLLEPLSVEESALLVAELGGVDEELGRRIREAAEGNPLFVEEMVALVHEAGDGEIVVPATIQALLAARLDQLDPSERGVLERGSVEGRVFHRGAVEALAPDESGLSRRLVALVRKELVRPDRALLAGDDAYRFRHLLIRDAAYDALPKAVRAELHERFAAWLEERGSDLVELDEITGYHLEQAWRYRAELGAPADAVLAQEARVRLVAAGRKAVLRDDTAASANLFERGAALVPEGEIDLALELDLIDALFLTGRLDDARRRAEALAARGRGAGSRLAELCGQLREGIVEQLADPQDVTERLESLAREAMPVFEEAGDDLALYVANWALGMVAHNHARMDDALEAIDRALEHARRTGLQHLEVKLASPAGATRLHGTTPATQLLAWLDEQEGRGIRDDRLLMHRASALVMLGRPDEAREIMVTVRTRFAERGAMVFLALANSHASSRLELAAGNAAAAVEFGEDGCRQLEQLGHRGWLSTGVGILADAYYELGRLEQAESWAGRAAELGASDDATTQMIWRQVRAKVLARRGDALAAERLASEAVSIGEATDMIDAQGDARRDLAEVLALAGRHEGAAAQLQRALELYEQKENILMAGRTRERLEAMRAEPTA